MVKASSLKISHDRLKRLLAILIAVIFMISAMPNMALADTAADKGAKGELKIGAQSACSYCPRTGEFVYQKNMNKRVAPASTTKLLTAILAVENLDMDDTVYVTPEIERVAEAEMFLQRGEVVKVRDLLNAMLIESANDAAVALAIAVAGNVKDFAKMMNKRAKKYGCKDTHFVNPNGLADPNHYSSAHDMALIAEKAFDNKIIRKICGTQKYKMAATNGYIEREFENTNLLIRDDEKIEYKGKELCPKYPGVFAGKTGTLTKSEASLIVGVKDGDFEFISVILNTWYKRREVDSIALIDYTKEHMARDIAFEKGDKMGRIYVKHGAKTFLKVVTGGVGYLHLPEGATLDDLDMDKVSYENVVAPIKKGEAIGKVVISYQGEKLGRATLVAAESTEEGWLPSYIGISNTMTVAIVVLILAFIAIRKFGAKAKRKKKRA